MNKFSTEFLALVFVFYLAATFAFSIYLRNFSGALIRLARWFLVAGVLLHLGELIALFYGTGQFFPTTSAASLLLVTAIIAAICFFLSFKRQAILFIVILLPLVDALLAIIHFASEIEVVSTPPSPWLWTHILSILAGEALFCLAAVCSFLYLLSDSRLRNREVSVLFSRIPALPELERFLIELIWGGFILLTLGMLIGFFFARQFWSSGWILDPKVLFCLLAWFVFALILFLRSSQRSFGGRKNAVATLVGFFLILFVTVGVDFIFHSQHQNLKIEQTNP